MASLDEIHRMVLDNSRAIRGNGDGGMKSQVAVIQATVDRIETKLSGSSFATQEDLEDLKKDLRVERKEDLENLKGRIKTVKEGSIDWKWLLTAILAIISPIAVGIYMSVIH